MRSANPALTANTFDRQFDRAAATTGTMTLNGTVMKTGILLALTAISAAMSWNKTLAAPDAAGGLILIGALGGFILAMVTAFKQSWAPVTSPFYAILEGLFLGGISAIFEQKFHGIVFQAVGLTFGTLAALLLAYSSGMIRATENFKLGVVAATGGICLVYLVSIVLNLFHIRVPYIHDSGLIGIGFSIFVVIIAALNLVLDFDFIESGVERGAPKFMEWYAAFGLLVTLIWLYIEFLRLLAKLQSNRS